MFSAFGNKLKLHHSFNADIKCQKKKKKIDKLDEEN